MEPSGEKAKRGDKRARTRARLVAAAVAAAEEKGLAAASLDEIAARAGMTKGAIYSNFASKAELVMAVVEDHGVKLAPDFAAGAPLAAHLDALAEAVIAVLPLSQARSRLSAELQAYAASDPDLRERVGEMHRGMLAGWSRTLAQAHGRELGMSANDLVVALQALAGGLALQHRLTPELVTPQAVRAAFAALARGAGKAPDGRAPTA